AMRALRHSSAALRSPAFPGPDLVQPGTRQAGYAPVSSPDCALDRHGWLRPAAGVTIAPSPNFDLRPADTSIGLLVIHNISLPPGIFGGKEITDLFLNRLDYSSHPWLERLRGLRVSAHFLIRRDGTI